MDIDDELQMLQRQLMAVQQQKTNPLSQRTVAQIMIKLQQQGLKFFATTDGNEYVTPDRLDNEIIQFVQERGRTKIGILPQLLNLNQELIQARINKVCQKSTHIRNNDNLLSKDYIRNFVHSIKQKLQLDGTVALDQLALAQQFNMPFLMKIINQHLSQLDAEILGNQLSTKQFKRMKKKRILGFLLAINKPINIQVLVKTLHIYDFNPEIHIQQLILEGKLKGRCLNSHYIPDKFSINQKQMIQKFFDTNGYIDFAMIEKNFKLSKPEDWIKKNLKGNYVILQQICFNKHNLECYHSHVQSLMKSQGFFQISNVIQLEMNEKKLHKFLSEYCEIKDFIIDDGICYSQDWLMKCTNQFRDKVIYDIFFNKSQNKGKKKTAKKDKQQNITEQQLIQVIFDAGLAQYSVAERIASSLVPIIMQRLQNLKDQLQKQLSQNQGVITNAFLKYRKCKTIIKSQTNLQRVINTIEKQKKKGQQWSDPDFGITEADPLGKYSLIYYDGIFPKQWGELENIEWRMIPFKQLVSKGPSKSKYLQKSHITNILQILDHHNSITKADQNIETPNFKKIPGLSTSDIMEQDQSQITAPFPFKFYVGQQLTKYVLVDSKMPFLHEECLGSRGLYGLIEKAYAKLRYCYKGLLNIGIQQQIFQLTGLTSTKIAISSEKDEKLEELMGNYLQKGNLVIAMGQGEVGKKIKIEGDETQFRSCTPYQVSSIQSQQTLVKIFPGERTVEAKLLPKIFKNIYIIQNKSKS